MASKLLIQLGVLAVRQNPTRLVGISRTFQHPSGNTTVTLFPVPSLGHHTYFEKVLYNLHGSYDRIVLEDGVRPLHANSFDAKAAGVFRKILPWVPQRPVAGTDTDLMKYMVPHNAPRDPLETRMAYTSVLSNTNPPVDPRSRRAIEFISNQMIAVDSTSSSSPSSSSPSLRIAMPWNVYHMVYLKHRLAADGWKETETRDVDIITQYQMVNLIFAMSLALTVVVLTFLATLKTIIFG